MRGFKVEILNIVPVVPRGEIHHKWDGEFEGLFHLVFDETGEFVETTGWAFEDEFIVNLQEHPS